MIQTAVAILLDDEGHGDYQPDGAGGDLFIDLMPDTPDQAVQIRVIGGPGGDGRHPYTTRRVQILTRGGRDPRDAGDRAQQLHDALDGRANEVWPDGTQVIGCFAVAPPAYLGVDDGLRITYSFHLMVETREPTDHRGGW